MDKQEKSLPSDDKIAKLEKQCEEYLAGWKRARADYDNLLKDSAREKDDFCRFANANLIIELLPLLDNFKAAFNQIPEAEKNSGWVTGFSFIKKQLEDFLTNQGVEVVKTVGEKFDPELHEAVGKAVDETKDEGVVLEEKKAGYKLHGKVVQAARVVVNEK